MLGMAFAQAFPSTYGLVVKVNVHPSSVTVTGMEGGSELVKNSSGSETCRPVATLNAASVRVIVAQSPSPTPSVMAGTDLALLREKPSA
jgi:hypothetical protein